MTFDAASLLSSRANSADEGAIIRMSQRTRELRAQGKDVISLTLGEPDFDTPLHIQEAATAAMRAGHTHYSPVPGLPELREALARKLRAENALAYDAANIVLSNGAKQAINNAMLALIGPGDEVIIPAPFWLSYEGSATFAGGTSVILPSTIHEKFKTPVSRIAEAITDKTKLIVINSPSNPSGALWTRAELEDLASLVRQHPRLMVMSDEIYEYIVFDGEMVSFGSLPGMIERTITINGFSKGFAMTGWRLGYAAAPEPIAKAMARMQSVITTGANSFVQRAAIAALESPRDSVVSMRNAYHNRRDMVLAALRNMPGLAIGDIPATFYALPDVSAFFGRSFGARVINTSQDLCDYLLEDAGVATVPGSAFGAPETIRLSFATSEENLQKAMARMARGLGQLT